VETNQHVPCDVDAGNSGSNFQTIIHSPAWVDLKLRLRIRGKNLPSGKVPNTLHWDLLSMAVSQIEPTLKPYDTYLPPLNSRRTQDGPLNSLDEVQSWTQLHRPKDTEDRECGNLEFLCTLNTPSPERLKYLLQLCKEKKLLISGVLPWRHRTCLSPSGRERPTRRTEEDGGYELSRKSSLRDALNAGEYGQRFSWPTKAAQTAK